MIIGFIADAHGNYLAYLKSLEILKNRHIENIYFLGDSIGYFDSDQVVKSIADKNIPSIKGNHEQMVLDRSVPIEKEKFYRLKRHFASNIVDIIETWPEYFVKIINNKKIYMVHGSYDDPIWGYTTINTSWKEPLGFDLFVCGATHRPFIKKIGNKIIANVGSCGFPRDKGKIGSLGIYDTYKHEFEIIRFCIKDSISYIKENHINLEQAVLNIFER